MLKSLDVVIGLTVILLALSMAVTVITQALTTVVNSRGRHLRRGLVDLLQQLDPALTETVSRTVATTILTHPLVSGSAGPMSATDASGIITRVRRLAGGARLGNVVHREEFTKLLMASAAGGGTGQLPQAARSALAAALKSNGVADPEATLKSIRSMALQLERSAPELSTSARQNMAILHAAESDFVAKINNWFDQTMDRTSQRFTASTRVLTFAGAFLVAFALQVDTPLIVNRLAADDQLRAAFVQEAAAMQRTQQPAAAGTQTTTAGAPSQEEISRKYRAFLATNGIITLPSAAGWKAGYSNLSALLGMLVTALLLSMGAPFWYSALGRLLQLRSALAAKDDTQREQRQLDQTAAMTGRSVVLK